MPLIVHPPALSLPMWPSVELDTEGAAYLIVCIGGLAEAEAGQARIVQAESLAPTIVISYDDLGPAEAQDLTLVYRRSRVGVRILVVGGQYDVLQALALARSCGVLPAELRCIVTHTRDLPVFCAHCRTTSRIDAQPGDEVDCPGCALTVEIHSHTSEIRGSFLASAANAGALS